MLFNVVFSDWRSKIDIIQKNIRQYQLELQIRRALGKHAKTLSSSQIFPLPYHQRVMTTDETMILLLGWEMKKLLENGQILWGSPLFGNRKAGKCPHCTFSIFVNGYFSLHLSNGLSSVYESCWLAQPARAQYLSMSLLSWMVTDGSHVAGG